MEEPFLLKSRFFQKVQEHSDQFQFEHSVMFQTLPLSTRCIPLPLDIVASDAYYDWLAASGSNVKRRKW
jgi:hypothetical protein